ncbi:sensor histidine kinase [Cohnella xylanilytica]|uniref:Sensor histidine kinase n=1 Tax=Cohnella xylanilytica TaxID=557555 RepID=A0A841U7W4_9BACL|nr:sensor histidine kinase [Cohnella xylanilytica]MBB6694111.1 sensor histidine kinase [Cohnella xylanilytica]GIO14413.1 sensor histidine kinase [Cohnella xylanilytica]
MRRSGGGTVRTYIAGLPIQAKLILSFVLIIFIPIVLFAWYVLSGISDSSIREITKKAENILDIEKNNVQNNIDLMEWTSQLAESNQEMNDYLQRADELNTDELLEFKTKIFDNFEHFLFNNPRIAAVRLYTSNPRVYEFWPVVLQESRIRSKPWYETVLEQNGMNWWEIRSNIDVLQSSTDQSAGNGPYVSLLRELKYSDETTHNGVLEVSMGVRQFFTKTFSVREPSSQLLVVARDGQIYTDAEAEIFRHASAKELTGAIRLASGTDNRTDMFRYGGQSYLAVQAYVPTLGVHLVNVVSLADTMADIQRARANLLFVVLLLAAVLIVVSSFMHSLILKRLKVLRDSMKKVRGGDFHLDVPVYGADEVGELGHHYRQMLKKINELIVEQVNRQAATKEAEIRSLKNQIDSHFLYNTLENLKMLAEVEGQYTISDSLTSLGGMMRYSLQWTHERVRLRDEIDHIRNYIAIMNIRYDGLLELRVDVPPEYLDQEVLKMSLQPIVENAVKHGMNPSELKDGKLQIILSAAARQESFVIEISDNGSGIGEDRLRRLNRMLRMEEADYRELRSEFDKGKKESGGIGLRNVEQRLVMSYGLEYGIRVESVEGSFTRVVMTLPKFDLGGGESR